jgi:hypothetical protein
MFHCQPNRTDKLAGQLLGLPLADQEDLPADLA